MSRRSRARRQSRQRLPLIAFVMLLVLGAGAWWWSQRDDAPAPSTTTALETPEPTQTSAVLALPPVEQTRPGALAGEVPDVAPPVAPAKTAIHAPASRGTEPRVAPTDTSTAGSLARRNTKVSSASDMCGADVKKYVWRRNRDQGRPVSAVLYARPVENAHTLHPPRHMVRTKTSAWHPIRLTGQPT